MQKKYLFILIAIVALGGFLRFYRITEIPLGLYPDEAMNGNNDLEAITTHDFKVFYPENNGREGLFINLQAISVAAFGAKPWALRIVSAILGTFTILSLYLVTKELFRGGGAASLAALDRRAGMVSEQSEDERGGHVSSKSALGILNGREDAAATPIALLASFFLATSYWHLNFSRIGFRAIMLPLMATFAMYFLLKGLRTGKTLTLAAAGILAGLGFYTYIAYRFMIFAALVPIVWYMWQWKKNKRQEEKKCMPCAVMLFLFITFVTALPIGIYFLRNPEQFLNRADEISVFSAVSPVKELGWSVLKTTGMFFWRGDCNWRHNYNCQPELHPMVAVFFLAGIAAVIRRVRRQKLAAATLFAWLGAMAVPVILTREGIPHALRAIGMMSPVLILSAAGAESLGSFILSWFQKQKSRWSAYTHQLARIQQEMKILFVLVLLILPLATYHTYFILWAENKETYQAFDTSSWHLGQFLAGTEPGIRTYVVANTLGKLVRGIPMSAQTVMFATNTFPDGERRKKDFIYLTGSDARDNIVIPAGQKTLIAFLDGGDHALIRDIQKKYPELKVKVPGDFVVLQNF